MTEITERIFFKLKISQFNFFTLKIYSKAHRKNRAGWVEITIFLIFFILEGQISNNDNFKEKNCIGTVILRYGTLSQNFL